MSHNLTNYYNKLQKIVKELDEALKTTNRELITEKMEYLKGYIAALEATKEEKYLQCEKCGKRDETVQKIECGYQREINNEHVFEVICDDCEQKHLDDI